MKEKIKKLKNAVNADVADDIGELLKLSYEKGARDQRKDDIEFISGYFNIGDALDGLEEEPLIKAE